MADFQQLIGALNQNGNRLSVWRDLEQTMRQEGTTGNCLLADNLLADTDLSDIPLKPMKIFVLRSFTLEQLVPVLRVKALLSGIQADIAMGDFNQYHQEVLDPGSLLYRHDPEVVILAVRLSDLAPELVGNFLALDEAQVRAAVESALATISSLVKEIRSRSNAAILVHNFEVPAAPDYGVLDYQQANGQIQTISSLNTALVQLCRSVPGCYVVDYDGLSARYGKSGWVDQRMMYLARTHVHPKHLPHLAEEYVRFFIPLAGLTRKCLVLDMDNTLWGGIIGEDGLSGIKLGTEYPGAAFADFQRAVLNLYRRGVILALCSKNNPEEALDVLDNHPDMVLRREHFASFRINWADKAANLVEIAQELNIGLDSLVFLDDNPAEIAQVREAVPEILAYRLPQQPEQYGHFLTSLPYFEMLTLTAEDKRRGEEYRQQVQRRSLEVSSTSMEDFYRKLEMRATIAPASEMTLARIAQLTQKTNQFNLTTRRYSEQEIRSHIADGSWHVYSLDLDDRFGRNGLVGVGILRPEGNDAWIDTLLLSCRVMGRTVEQSFVHFLASEAQRMGFTRLVGEYLPTAKNRVVAELYDTLGFHLLERTDKHGVWEARLEPGALAPSEFIDIQVV